MNIPFNKPYMTGSELGFIEEARRLGRLSGDGHFTVQCQEWLQSQLSIHRALLTHSCTAALEMAAILLDIQPGDEIIMPSYTFVSTANAFVLRGGVPVFVDIRPDTLNLDESLIEAAITDRTRAIVPVHYAGVACEMDTILAIARKYALAVVEDAAQGVMSSYKGYSLGSMGTLGAYSFHETKNIISGEGGALVINDASLVTKAEICREKGTDRSRFFRGEVDKYSWQAMGSSFMPGELIAAFLWGQLTHAKVINRQRLQLWDRYHSMLEPLEQKGLLRRPIIPDGCQHNAHMYYVLLPRHVNRDAMLAGLKAEGVDAVFHYVPLHSSPAGSRFGRVSGSMTHTDELSERLIRLPLWMEISPQEQEYVASTLAGLLDG